MKTRGPPSDRRSRLAFQVVGSVSSLAAGSEAVTLARQVVTPGEGRWIPDDADREGSFAALVMVSVADKGSRGRFLAIPLRFVVSYRSDPEVRERWERIFNSLLS